MNDTPRLLLQKMEQTQKLLAYLLEQHEVGVINLSGEASRVKMHADVLVGDIQRLRRELPSVD